MTFHLESALIKGCAMLKAGDVIRVFDGAFGEAVILGFNEAGEARVSRPYVYASGVGTTGPIPLLGAETYTLTAADLRAVIQGFGPIRANGRRV